MFKEATWWDAVGWGNGHCYALLSWMEVLLRWHSRRQFAIDKLRFSLVAAPLWQLQDDLQRRSTAVIWFCVLLVPAMQSKGCLLSTIGRFQTSIDSFKRLGVWGQAGCVPAFESGLIMAYLSCTFYPLDKLNMSQASVSRNFSPDLHSWHFVFADLRGIDHLLGEEDWQEIQAQSQASKRTWMSKLHSSTPRLLGSGGGERRVSSTLRRYLSKTCHVSRVNFVCELRMTWCVICRARLHNTAWLCKLALWWSPPPDPLEAIPEWTSVTLLGMNSCNSCSNIIWA